MAGIQLYAIPSELTRLAPALANKPALNTEAAQYSYINAACALIDDACNRAVGGLGVREIYDEQVYLDFDFQGKLAYPPHRAWIGETVNVFVFGDNSQSTDSFALSEFGVGEDGLIRNLSRRGYSTDGRWTSGATDFRSPYQEAAQSYHIQSRMRVQPNRKPYVASMSYVTGFFTETSLEVSGAIGATTVTVSDAAYLKRGQEFYFDSDPASAPQVARRTITSVNQDTREIGFQPALTYVVSQSVMFRQIDRIVRSAVGEIINEFLTFPTNTKQFVEGLGKSDLYNSWTRMTAEHIPPSVQSKLALYRRR